MSCDEPAYVGISIGNESHTHIVRLCASCAKSLAFGIEEFDAQEIDPLDLSDEGVNLLVTDIRNIVNTWVISKRTDSLQPEQFAVADPIVDLDVSTTLDVVTEGGPG